MRALLLLCFTLSIKLLLCTSLAEIDGSGEQLLLSLDVEKAEGSGFGSGDDSFLTSNSVTREVIASSYPDPAGWINPCFYGTYSHWRNLEDKSLMECTEKEEKTKLDYEAAFYRTERKRIGCLGKTDGPTLCELFGMSEE